MRGSVADQNRAEYAEPMYWYTLQNGTAFPSCSMIFIHHDSKQGDSRGTSALVDAVDEDWGIRRPEDKEKDQYGNKRIITINKSRLDNEGRRFLVERNDDYTLQLLDPKDYDVAGLSAIDGLLAQMRIFGDWMSWSQIKVLEAGGKTEASKGSNLRRLVNRGLIERRGSTGKYLYRAIRVENLSMGNPPKGEGILSLRQEIPVVNWGISKLSYRHLREDFETQETDSEMLIAREDDIPSAGTDLSYSHTDNRSLRDPVEKSFPQTNGLSGLDRVPIARRVIIFELRGLKSPPKLKQHQLVQ